MTSRLFALLLLSSALLVACSGRGCDPLDPSEDEPTAPQDSPDIASFGLSEDHELYPHLADFLAHPHFVDEHCVVDWCEVQLFDLPRKAQVRRHGVWNPRDYYALWDRLRADNVVRGKAVLDLGTGSGPLGLLMAHYGADRIVATDINPAAVANARRNAERMGWADRFDVRQVSEDDPGAYAVIAPGERFELIVSNPPYDDAQAEDIEDYAESDPGYQFIRSMLRGLPAHLTPTGSMLLLYAEPAGMKPMQEIVREMGLVGWIHLAEGKEDFATHRLRAREADYGAVIPIVEIYPPRSTK